MSGKIEIPGIKPTAEITHTVHVTKTLGNYKLIIGQDLLHELGVDIIFSSKTVTWNNVAIDMKPTMCTREDVFHVVEELFVSDDTDQIAALSSPNLRPPSRHGLRGYVFGELRLRIRSKAIACGACCRRAAVPALDCIFFCCFFCFFQRCIACVVGASWFCRAAS